jgi:hypothetical protein
MALGPNDLSTKNLPEVKGQLAIKYNCHLTTIFEPII